MRSSGPDHKVNDPGPQQRQGSSACRPPPPIIVPSLHPVAQATIGDQPHEAPTSRMAQIPLPNTQETTHEKPPTGLPIPSVNPIRSPPTTHRVSDTPPSHLPLRLNKPLPALPRRSAAKTPHILHDTPMKPPTVSCVVTWLGENLAHIPYVVTGVAALIMHGFGGRLPTHISVLCPDHSKNVMRAWAAAKGVVLYPTEKEFGVLLPGEKSHVRRVRMKFVSEERFTGIETVYMRKGRVLSLTTLVDVLAEEFMDMTGDEAGEGRVLLGGGIVWAAERLVEMGPEGVWRGARYVGNPLFLEPFDCTFPGAKALFHRAGLIDLDGAPQPLPGTPGARSLFSHSSTSTFSSTSSEFGNYIWYNEYLDGERPTQKRGSVPTGAVRPSESVVLRTRAGCEGSASRDGM